MIPKTKHNNQSSNNSTASETTSKEWPVAAKSFMSSCWAPDKKMPNGVKTVPKGEGQLITKMNRLGNYKNISMN